MAAERLPDAFTATVKAVCIPLADRIAAGHGGQVVGFCGSQASGKSTITAVVRQLLEMKGLKVALFSLDDIYLTRAARQALAADVHPLFTTRGVPGTHDVALGGRLIEDLLRAGETLVPAFDKAADDRRPQADWPRFQGPADIVLFEGWCVGARAQGEAVLIPPINDLERERDAKGIWRRRVNAELGGPYAQLFSRLTTLVLFQAPSFEVVLSWRLEQERKLRERLAREGGDASRVMSDAAVDIFIRHYERLTRHILAEMPDRADVVIRLDADRRPL